MIRSMALGLAAVAGLVAGAAHAQDQLTPAEARVGAFRNITATGETKPPGEPLGPREGTSPQLREEHHNIDQRVLRSICTGAPGCQDTCARV